MRLSKLNIKRINFDDIDSNYSGQDILFKLGELYQFESGIYGYGNIWTKFERNITDIIIEEMDKIDAIQISLPKLQPKKVWEQSGRWRLYTDDTDTMFTVENNLGSYGLSPTAEECVTIFGSNRLASFRNLPAIYYQIGEKFRKEIRTRGYIFRTREFIMFDAYSFDKNEEEMLTTYNKVKDAYFKIFKRLGIFVIPTVTDSGTIGGKVSHEWQAKFHLGEDEIVYDNSKNIGLNSEVLEFDNKEEYLKRFGISDLKTLEKFSSIELGHTFQLGNKYSKSMQLYYQNEKDEASSYYMGCYGLGVSRIAAYIIENNIIRRNGTVRGFVFPYDIAPYKVHIIYSENNREVAEKLYTMLQDKNIPAIIDDRENIGLGTRINDVSLLGTPKLIVLGNKFNGHDVEIETLKDNTKETVNFNCVIDYFTNL